MKHIEGLCMAIRPNGAKSIDHLEQSVAAAERATLRLVGNGESPKSQQSPLTAHEIGAALPIQTA